MYIQRQTSSELCIFLAMMYTQLVLHSMIWKKILVIHMCVLKVFGLRWPLVMVTQIYKKIPILPSHSVRIRYNVFSSCVDENSTQPWLSCRAFALQVFLCFLCSAQHNMYYKNRSSLISRSKMRLIPSRISSRY